jgi:hypothetical protein
MRFPIRKMLLTLILCVGFVLTTPMAHADAWGANMAAMLMKQVMEKIARQIEGALLGSLKMTAMNMLNSQIGQLIGGGGGAAPRFITNWEDALIADPTRRTQLYMNDFFTLSTRGMGSSANYIRAGVPVTIGANSTQLNNPLAMNDPFTLRAEGVNISGGSVTGGNYAQYLERVGRAAISGGGQKTMTLNEYTPSPEVMFQQGDWRAFDSFISNPMNNPYGYSIAAEQAYQTKLEQEKEIARTEAIAYQGFKGTETSGGNITTPGSTIKSIVDNANDFGNKIISGASNPAEILSSLAATAANKAINGLVQKGIGEVQSQINREIGAINNQARAIVNEATTALGPGAKFLPEIQRGISLNSDFTKGLSSSGPVSSSARATCSSSNGTCYTGNACSSLWKVTTSDCPDNGGSANCCVPTSAQ